MEKEMEIRFRYSRVPYVTRKGNFTYLLKNTLATKRMGDHIFFGIAFCNLNEDVPSKKEGKKFAIARLEQACSYLPAGRSFIAHTGDMGYFHVDDARVLKAYFEDWG